MSCHRPRCTELSTGHQEDHPRRGRVDHVRDDIPTSRKEPDLISQPHPHSSQYQRRLSHPQRDIPAQAPDHEFGTERSNESAKGDNGYCETELAVLF